MSAQLVGGRYQLHSELGRGGMAVVWRGVDMRLGRPVAIKVLDASGSADPARLARVDREARTIAALTHPNIVAVYDFGLDQGRPYLVLELVDGTSLQSLLARGPLELHQVIEIATQVCDALAAAHGAGVVHRDIKPDNILFTATGTAKVCDFGIASLSRNAGPGGRPPEPVVGTAHFMAPEQSVAAPVDARTDLYALGCVLYAMLAGHPPFPGEDPLLVVRQHQNEPVTTVGSLRSGVPAELDALVSDLLAKRPTDRPATASQVRTRLMLIGEELLPAAMTAVASGGGASAIEASGIGASIEASGGTGGAAGGAHRENRGRASVASRTQAMPDLIISGDPASVGGDRLDGFRLGPVGIAGVAIVSAMAAALVAAVIVAALLGSGQHGQIPVAGASGSATISPSSSVSSGPAGAVDALRSVIRVQVLGDQLSVDSAESLTNILNDLERRLTRGQTDRAVDRVDDLRHRLDQLRDDDKITSAGYTAISASIDALAVSLPRVNHD